MCGKGSCAGSGQLHSTTYTHTISYFHSLPHLDGLCSRNSFTTKLADAPGLSWDCRYLPLLAGAGNLGTPVGHGLLGYSIEIR